MKTKIEGLREINAVLSRLPKSVGKPVLTRFAKKRLEPMRADAVARAPHLTGELQENIVVSPKAGAKAERRERARNATGVDMFMGPTFQIGPKARAQEFGSIHNAPQGYMRGAWDAGSDKLLDNLAEDLGGTVMAAAGRYAKRQARKG